jgi:ketosteroid isomerase-like protein
MHPNADATDAHPNAVLIRRFYDAFAARDADAMAACYHPEIEFHDPAFGTLHGAQAVGMWRMLTERGKDLKVVASGIEADDDTGRAHWEAWYTFTATGRPVHNQIDATFAFRDGLIVRHHDHFPLWRWSRQALGLKGQLLGWLPPVQNAIRKQARGQLERYLAKS